MRSRMAGKRRKRGLPLLLAFCMGLAFLAGCWGARTPDPEKALEKTAAHVLETTPSPGISSIGGEWAVIGLAASGIQTEDYYYESYYDSVRAAVKSRQGILSEDTYTEYARVTLALCALGKDPKNVEGFDLTEPLDDFAVVTDQGVNAAAFALIVANVAGVRLENEENYIAYILEDLELENMYADDGLEDYLIIALEGLSFYRGRSDVEEAVNRGLEILSSKQNEDGSMGNCETTAEMILTLTQLGIDPAGDERFIKEGNSLQDGLMKYYLRDGSFCHTLDGESNAMATEKALLAQDALQISQDGKRLYEGAIS